MKTICLILLVPFFLVATSAAYNVLEDDSIRAVYSKNGQIFVSLNLGEPGKQITTSLSSKALPVWSKDGQRIAFIEGADSARPLGKLVVINTDGQVLGRVLLRNSVDSVGGMRFIESLEWIHQDKLAISGSVNPSLTETTIVNLATSTEQGNVFDDGPGADFSPNGNHFAYASGSPHFTPQDKREPALNVDYVRVFPEPGRHVDFVSDRRWSPDSKEIAVIVEDFVTKRQSLIVWSSEGGVSETAVTLPESTIADLFWSGHDIVIATAKGELQIVPSTRSIGSVAGGAVDPLLKAKSERGARRDNLKKLGGEDVDFWCRACAMAALSRKVRSDND